MLFPAGSDFDGYVLSVTGGKIDLNGAMVSSAKFTPGDIVTITANPPSTSQALKIWTPSKDVEFLGSVLGVFLAGPSGKALCRVIFSLFGMKRVNFGASLSFKAVSALGIVLMAVATAAVMGLRVRRCRPVEMITEE